jgi:hypothetical protein
MNPVRRIGDRTESAAQNRPKPKTLRKVTTL